MSFDDVLLSRRELATDPIDTISTADRSRPRSSAIADRTNAGKSDPGDEIADEWGKPTKTSTMITTYVDEGGIGELDKVNRGVNFADWRADADGVVLEITAQADIAPVFVLRTNDANEISKGEDSDATLLGREELAISLPSLSRSDMIAPFAR